MSQSATTKSKGIFYGWWIVGACSLITLYGSGIFFYGFTAFFEPMVDEMGWSRAATSLAFSLQRLQGGIAAPIIGFLVDKLGPNRLQTFGMLVMGGGLMFMSQVDSITIFYIAFLVTSIGSASGSGTVGQVAVANWFVRNRGKALGITAAGVGISGTLVPILVWLISSFGWRTTLILAGAGCWVFCIPLSLVVRNKPENYGMLPDGDTRLAEEIDKKQEAIIVLAKEAPDDQEFTPREALRTSAFWVLALALSIGQLATGAIFTHELPYLNSIGIPPQTGAFVVMAITLTSIVGRLGFGWLGDLFEKRHVMAITYVLQVAGIMIAAFATELWQVALFVITFGPGYGGSIPVRPALQADYFGRKSFGTIQGFILGLTTFGGVIGPTFAGWMYDVNQSYRMAFIILALGIAPAVPAILAARRPVKKQVDPERELSLVRVVANRDNSRQK